MLLLSINIILLAHAITKKRDISILYSRIAIISLIYSSLLLSINFFYFQNSVSLYNGLFFCKIYTLVFTFFIFFLTCVILSLTSFYPRKIIYDNLSHLQIQSETPLKRYFTKLINKNGEQFKIAEYSLLILFVIMGAIFLISSSDLISIFLSIELQSYGLYLLSTIYRNSELSTNAGLTYFLLGGLSSCIILLGQSLLYINSGNTNLDILYIINSILVNNIDEISKSNINIINIPGSYQYYIQFSLIILSTGFLFKISAAPFHFWSPDVYDAIPTIVTTFVAIIAKISIFLFFLELVYYTTINSLDLSWKNNILMSSFLSLFIGSILGLTQFRIKRLYAYSTISHIGFILLALGINSVESIQAYFFYIIQYSVTNLNAFIILITIGYSFFSLRKKTEKLNNNKDNDLKDKNLSPIQLISQIKGYFYINPIMSISLAITLFSFIGVPPLMGFFAKQMILSAALDNGYIFMALVAILTSSISAVYYLVVIKNIFFEETEYEKNDQIKYPGIEINNIVFLSSSLTSYISIFTLTILLFIFLPDPIIKLSNILSLVLFNN